MKAKDITALVNECVKRIMEEIYESWRNSDPESYPLDAVIERHVRDLFKEHLTPEGGHCFVKGCKRKAEYGGLCAKHDTIVENIDKFLEILQREGRDDKGKDFSAR